MLKRISTGLFVTVFSIVMAYGSKGSMRNAWVKVKFLGTDLFVCLNTGLVCNEPGGQTCRVDVQTVAGPVSVQAKSPAACVSTIGNNSYISVGIYEPVLGLIEDIE